MGEKRATEERPRGRGCGGVREWTRTRVEVKEVRARTIKNQRKERDKEMLE